MRVGDETAAFGKLHYGGVPAAPASRYGALADYGGFAHAELYDGLGGYNGPNSSCAAESFGVWFGARAAALGADVAMGDALLAEVIL